MEMMMLIQMSLRMRNGDEGIGDEVKVMNG